MMCSCCVKQSLAYEFTPSETFSARSFGLTILLNYKDSVSICLSCVCLTVTMCECMPVCLSKQLQVGY
jgi:hypothetical protein